MIIGVTVCQGILVKIVRLKLISVPIVLVKTMQHVKTSKHITHVLVWLDFKVSTVKQTLMSVNKTSAEMEPLAKI